MSKKVEKRELPELLSPVGGRAQLEAAVNNGADAVYMGGSLFNARINAENFKEDTLADAIAFAHERGVKVYITLNTLIKDSELERAFRYANRLYEMGADALILQDMGLARLIHKYLPDFPMHLSTQGTVYNVHAIDLVKQLGFRRLVPARELSLEEIRSLCAKAHDNESKNAVPLEVEVFVHGALCMCYSGQCQMSRAFGGGGRSGNRGLCAQPCRLLYTDDKGRKGYFLSPKDLCALELIPQLVSAGVDSFKIEGRLKSAEYVAATTAVYRKYLDQYASIPGGKVSPEEWKAMLDPADVDKLLRVFNRGGFTTGYLEGNPGDDILSGESPKNQGVYIGTVSGVSGVKGKGREKLLIDVRQDRKSGRTVSSGDGIEIRRPIDEADGKGAALVTGSSVATFVKRQENGLLRIGDFDSGARTGDRVYKVTDRSLRDEVLSVPDKKIPVGMSFKAHLGSRPELEMKLKESDNGISPVKVEAAFAVEEAVNRPLTEEKIKAQLMKLGSTGFCADEADIEVDSDEGIMIPASVLNSIRRSAAEDMAAALRDIVRAGRKPLTDGEVDAIAVAEDLGNDAEVRRVMSLKRCEDTDTGEEKLTLLNVTKGEADKYIEDNFDSLTSDARGSGVLIGNLGWARQFMDAGVTVYGDYGLNAYNSQSIRAYEELGIKMLNLSHEMDSAVGTGDERFGGKIPLMITEHPFSTSYLIDRKGVKHEIINCRDKYIVL